MLMMAMKIITIKVNSYVLTCHLNAIAHYKTGTIQAGYNQNHIMERMHTRT
jgi:hypothetical protein